MKNLIPVLLAFALFFTNGCVNPPPNNVLKQSVIETPSNGGDIYHPVSVIQDDTFSFYKKYLPKKPPLSMMGYSVPYVSIEANEKTSLSTKSTDSTTNIILPKILLKTSCTTIELKEVEKEVFLRELHRLDTIPPTPEGSN